MVDASSETDPQPWSSGRESTCPNPGCCRYRALHHPGLGSTQSSIFLSLGLQRKKERKKDEGLPFSRVYSPASSWIKIYTVLYQLANLIRSSSCLCPILVWTPSAQAPPSCRSGKCCAAGLEGWLELAGVCVTVVAELAVEMQAWEGLAGTAMPLPTCMQVVFQHGVHCFKELHLRQLHSLDWVDGECGHVEQVWSRGLDMSYRCFCKIYDQANLRSRYDKSVAELRYICE
eukprot:1159361-Pelagomonas_calceolata.AAC.3